MNQCYGCNTCKSADKPLENYIRSLPMETSHHRVEGQSTKCGFGLQGVCCRLCSNGLAVLRQMLQEESAVQTPTQSLQETFCVQLHREADATFTS